MILDHRKSELNRVMELSQFWFVFVIDRQKLITVKFISISSLCHFYIIAVILDFRVPEHKKMPSYFFLMFTSIKHFFCFYQKMAQTSIWHQMSLHLYMLIPLISYNGVVTENNSKRLISDCQLGLNEFLFFVKGQNQLSHPF